MKNEDLAQLREERLENIEIINHFDCIGKDGRNCRYLVYLKTDNPSYYGTDSCPVRINDTIYNLYMRQGLSRKQAEIKAIEDMPVLVIEDLNEMLYYTSDYIMVH